MITKQHISFDIQVKESELDSFISDCLMTDYIDNIINNDILNEVDLDDDTNSWNEEKKEYNLVYIGSVPYKIELIIPGKYIINIKDHSLKIKYINVDNKNTDETECDYRTEYADISFIDVFIDVILSFIYTNPINKNENSYIAWTGDDDNMYYYKKKKYYKYTFKFINKHGKQIPDEKIFKSLKKAYPIKNITERLNDKFIEAFDYEAELYTN